MASATKYPQTIIQPYPANSRAHWKNVNNLKTESSNVNTNYAQTEKITASTGSRPSIETIQLQKFGFTIPEHAKITAIKVFYSYRVEADTSNKYPTIPQPTIMLKNSLGHESEVKGVTPSKDWKSKAVHYSSSDYKMPSPKTINSEGFGVEFRFPKNTSANAGYVFLNNVSIKVFYTIPSFPVDLVMVGDDNGEFVRDKAFRMQAVINNPDLSDSKPVIEFTVPSGTTMSYRSDILITSSGDVLTKISDTKYQLVLGKWGTLMAEIQVPNISTNAIVQAGESLTSVMGDIQKGSRTIEFDVIVPSTGDKTFTITEKLGNLSQSRTVTVIAQSTPIIDDSSVPMEQAIYAIQNTPFELPVKIPASMVGTQFYLYTDTEIRILKNNVYTTVSDWFAIPSSLFDEDGNCTLTCKTSNTGVINIFITNDNTSVPEQTSFVVRVVPEGYEVPRFTVLKLSTEEANRLGDGYKYDVSADMRINCLAANIQYFVDYYRNFRIGVVNEIPTTLNMTTVFNACKNWSNGLSVFNDFENKTVEFIYNKNYPVYIIITGNYDTTICNVFECEFGNLQIIESVREDGNMVIFPWPIKDTINVEDGHISTLTLPANTISNNLIFYDLGLNETFNSNMNIAIRGIAVRVTASSDSTGIISAQLKSPQGYTGERSALVDSGISHLIGGTTDRWGFDVSQLQDLPNFELEVNFSNLTDDEDTVSIEKVELITYFILYENQLVEWFVDGENMAGFNVFLQDAKIPEGLKTSTKYLTVDGTDTNDAYRQNIREKEITVEFTIDECSIEEATSTLQDIAQKIMTERDALYRPIPKRVEFSHYPGIYWEYILEDPIDADVDGSSYECKVKLTVPAGTAYNKEDTTTGSSGRVAGLAKVNPTIIVRPTSQHIEIEETFTDQKFLMSYNTWTSNDLVEIDCKNRKIYLNRDDEVIDITAYADWNTDWFLLFNQFLFKETGCVIQSVTWNERK